MSFSTGPFLLLLKQFSLDDSRAIHCSFMTVSLRVTHHCLYLPLTCYRGSAVEDCVEGQGWLGKWGNQAPQAGLKEWKGKGSHSEKAKEEKVGNVKWKNKKRQSISAWSPSTSPSTLRLVCLPRKMEIVWCRIISLKK